MTLGRRKFWTLAFWIGIFLVIVATFTILSAIKYSPQIPLNMELINYSTLSVTALSEDQLSALKGKKFSETPTNDPSVIDRNRLPKNTRVIPKGGFVTMDYQADRLNLYLDNEGKVEKVKIQ